MPKYRCGNCREESKLAPNARFCPYCGSTSLNLVIKELAEPAQKESVGVYEPPELGPDVWTSMEKDEPRPQSEQ